MLWPRDTPSLLVTEGNRARESIHESSRYSQDKKSSFFLPVRAKDEVRPRLTPLGGYGGIRGS
jgi:hypothetical protein